MNVTSPPAILQSQTSSSALASINYVVGTESNDEDTYLYQDMQVLKKNKFQIQRKISNTLQGCIYTVTRTTDDKVFAIKKTEKLLHNKRESALIDGISFVVEEDITKESAILRYLTSINSPISAHICKYEDFFESPRAYWLVMEFCGDTTLEAFCNSAHEYLKNGKLNLKEWRKNVKYLLWQLLSMIYWMHNDMNCCHLDLNMQNIMVMNGTFIKSKHDDTVHINPASHIKICDFGLSEIFHVDGLGEDQKEEVKENDMDMDEIDWNNPFLCRKFDTQNNDLLAPPKVINEEPYDARKRDIWQFGIIAFILSFGSSPILDKGLLQYITSKNLAKYSTVRLFDLLKILLNLDENQRIDSAQLIEHPFFKSYFSKYKEVIRRKSNKQRLQNQSQLKMLQTFSSLLYHCFE